MPSKLDQLRAGQPIEFKPGISGRLNKENKTLELSNGRVLNVAHDRDYFPENEQELAVSKQREAVEKRAKGTLGEFGHQFATQGLAGGANDMIAYLTQTGDEYANRKRAEAETSQRISKQSPYTSAAATAASFVPDLALTRGMSALKAAPLLTAGSAGSRLITDPAGVAGEAAFAGAAGFGLDKATNYLGKVAQRRRAVRDLPAQQQNVRNSNILGKQAVDAANADQAQAYNMLKQNVKNTNENLLKAHESDLTNRQNAMIQAKNNYEQAKLSRENEIVKLKNDYEIAKTQRSADTAKLQGEYQAAKTAAEQENKRLSDEFKLAQKQYQESLNQLPALQKKAQVEHSENVLENIKQIEKTFPKNSRINTSDLAISEFIENNINKSGIGGSKSANQAGRLLNSLFPEGEMLGGRELSKRYRALEDAIQKANPEVQTVLNEFKQHMGQKLPSVLEDTIVFSKIMPQLKKSLESDVRSIFRAMNKGQTWNKGDEAIAKATIQNLNATLREMDSSGFVKRLQSGNLSRELAEKIVKIENFLPNLTPENIKFMQKKGTFDILASQAKQKQTFLVDALTNKLQQKLGRYEIKALDSATQASKKFGRDIKKTYGMAEPVNPPSPPQPPSSVSLPASPGELPPLPPVTLPANVNPPQTPPMPSKPNLAPLPPAPTPQGFTPQVEPSLAPAQGLAERTGDFLEQGVLNSLPGAGAGKAIDPLLKLGGLKYLLGKAAIPAEVGYLGLKGLTAPNAAGEMARMTFKQGGIQAIETWAQRYPSYNNGILEDPQDRRSLNKEIENDLDIPIEQKALIQSKVNRGRPVGASL